MDLNRNHFLKLVTGAALAPVAVIAASPEPAPLVVRLAEFMDANVPDRLRSILEEMLMNHIGIFCRDAEIPAWLATDPRWPDVQRIIDESRRYREAKQTAPPEPPRPPQPTEAELVERALKHLEREDRGYFAQDLGTARRMYHDYPEFVTAPEFPAEQLADYVEYNGEEPPESEGLTPLSPGYAEHLMERAREYAREHLARAAA